MKKYLITIPIVTLIPKVVLAHCPLCTVGAGALAILAASLGISSIVVGVFIGAFSLALGLWISGTIKKYYIPYQRTILTIVIFLGTVIPIMPFIQHYGPLYVPFIGEYGTTYTINLYILGVTIGVLTMFVSPWISKNLTKVRGNKIPFQSIVITMSLLVLVSVLLQVLL